MILPYQFCYPLCEHQVTHHSSKIRNGVKFINASMERYKEMSRFVAHGRKPPKYLRYPRRDKLPPDTGAVIFPKRSSKLINESELDNVHEVGHEQIDGSPAIHDNEGLLHEGDALVSWDADEVEAISSLFQGRIPQKPGKLNRERPLPLPLPHKLRPMRFPTAKRHVRSISSDENSSRAMLTKVIYKDPVFLINLAREIRSLPKEDSVTSVLNKCSQFLRKGSLCLTIRELGQMGFPERALQTFCWAQKQPHLFPDDRILASTVEILARTRLLKLPDDMEKFIDFASRSVLEAMARGFIRGGSLNLALRFLKRAEKASRTLTPSVYVMLILELGKNPDKQILAIPLLEQLAGREDLELNHLDCTSLMKVCIRLGRFQVVESLFEWYKLSGHVPRVAMYTTVINSRYLEKKYREALALVWEMEAADYVFDLPAYRAVIRLCVALNDLSRTVRYFSKLKEAGFSPSYDIYRGVIYMYLLSGRLVKCREVCKELELSGFTLDAQLRSQLLHGGRNVNSV